MRDLHDYYTRDLFPFPLDNFDAIFPPPSPTARFGRKRQFPTIGEAWAYDRGYTDPIKLEDSRAYNLGFYDKEEERGEDQDSQFDPGCEWDGPL